MTLEPIFIRERVIKSIRNFFEKQDFHEIIPPILNEAVPLEPHIYPFSTIWKTNEEEKIMYLPISPEGAFKKIFSHGVKKAFAIGKSFRNLEATGSQHIPEFIMLEWYREGVDYQKIIRDTQELMIKIIQDLNSTNKQTLTYQKETITISGEWPQLSLAELFETHLHTDFKNILDDSKIVGIARKRGYNTQGFSWHALFDQLLVSEIEPQLPRGPFFLTDFPVRTSPLCTPKKDKPYLAERFELYMFGMELGNGNTEQTDGNVVKNIFMKEHELRKKNSLINSPVDYEFIQALNAMNKKKYAGMGLGVDRVAMIMADIADITDIEILYK